MENSPPRILHLIHWLNHGGIETWLLAMLQNVPRQEFAMDIAHKGSREGDLAPLAREAGAEFLHCPLGPTVYPFVQRLKSILARKRYSLLHVHTHAHSGPAVYAAKSVGVPVVTTFHNTQHPPETRFTRFPIVRQARSIYARRSMRYALQHSSECNGVSKAVAEAIMKIAKSARGQCKVFYLGCPCPQSVPSQRLAEYRRELGLSRAAPVVIHVGSFHLRKNHEAILRVFRDVSHATPEAILLLVGDGPLRTTVQRQIAELGLNDRVRLLGVRRDATALMQLAQVVLFPSLHEGLSIALMEANAIGLPIVASNIHANREVTNDGTAARLHNVSDIKGMAASVLDLINQPREAQRLASMGRQTYEETFSIGASVQRLRALYHNVLKRQQLQRRAA